MKYLKPFVLSILSCLLLTTAFSQKLTPKDLVGNWHVVDSSKSVPGIVLKFDDSNKVEFSLLGISGGIFNYSIDKSTNPASLFVNGTSIERMRFKDIWLIKLLGADTMKIQSQMLFSPVSNNNQTASQPPKWDDKEPFQTTGLLVRLKQ